MLFLGGGDADTFCAKLDLSTRHLGDLIYIALIRMVSGNFVTTSITFVNLGINLDVCLAVHGSSDEHDDSEFRMTELLRARKGGDFRNEARLSAV